MAITKAELVSIISDKCSFSRQKSVQIVEQVFQILKGTLEKGEKVKISGFGTFITRYYPRETTQERQKPKNGGANNDFREAGLDLQTQRNIAEGSESGWAVFGIRIYSHLKRVTQPEQRSPSFGCSASGFSTGGR